MDRCTKPSDLWELPILLEEMGLASVTKAVEASQSFDMEELVTIHNKGLNLLQQNTLPQEQSPALAQDDDDTSLSQTPRDQAQTDKFPIDLRDPASLNGLIRLWPDVINVDEIPSGTVTYGSLCVDALQLSSRIVTILDVGEKRAVVLSIDSEKALNLSEQDLRRNLPCGLTVAITDPHLTRLQNGSICILIHNIDGLIPVAAIPENSATHQSFIDGLRRRNAGDLDGAIQLFSAAIVSIQESVYSSTEYLDKADQNLVLGCYFQRAKAWLQKCSYENAIADANVLRRAVDGRYHIVMARALEGLQIYGAAYTHCKLVCDMFSAECDPAFMERCRDLYVRTFRSKFGAELSDSFVSYDWQHKRPYPSFVGPIQIKMLSDNSGRGLFVSEDCMAGDLVLVCDPIAQTLEESTTNWVGLHRYKAPTEKQLDELYPKVLLQANKSRVLRKRLWSLCSIHLEQPPLEAPDIHLFWPEMYEEERQQYAVEAEEESKWETIDPRQNICDLAVKLYSTCIQYPDEYSKTGLVSCGLYLLPGFINHSCAPSASRFYIGQTMFVIAARNMKGGDEITLSYASAVWPLIHRNHFLKEWRIGNCVCRRCKFEKSIADKIPRCLSIKSEDPRRRFHDDPDRLKQVADDVDTVLEEMRRGCILSPTERKWVLTSYYYVYLSGINPINEYKAIADYIKQSKREPYSPDEPHEFLSMSRRLEVLQAMQSTAPGHKYITELCMREAELILIAMEEGFESLEVRGIALDLARDACISLYGNLEPSTLHDVLDNIGDCTRKVFRRLHSRLSKVYCADSQSTEQPSDFSPQAGTAESSDHHQQRKNIKNQKQKKKKKK